MRFREISSLGGDPAVRRGLPSVSAGLCCGAASRAVHSGNPSWCDPGWQPGVSGVSASPATFSAPWQIRSTSMSANAFPIFQQSSKSTQNVSVVSASFSRMWFKPRKWIHLEWLDAIISVHSGGIGSIWPVFILLVCSCSHSSTKQGAWSALSGKANYHPVHSRGLSALARIA